MAVALWGSLPQALGTSLGVCPAWLTVCAFFLQRSTPSPGPPARESSSTLEKQVAANTHGAGGNAAGSKSLALAPTGEGSQRLGLAPPAAGSELHQGRPQLHAP